MKTKSNFKKRIDELTVAIRTLTLAVEDYTKMKEESIVMTLSPQQVMESVRKVEDMYNLVQNTKKELDALQERLKFADI